MKTTFSLWYFFLAGSLIAGAAIDGQGQERLPQEPPPDSFRVPGSVQDSSAASLGLPSVLVQNDFNIFSNPSLIVQYGTAYGEIWNVVRVISIPFVVFIITTWACKAEAAESCATGEQMSLMKVFKDRFPVFVLGFFGMTALSSLGWLGAEGSNTLHLLRDVMSWIFGIGLVGQGAYIDIRELKTAGGKPLRVGLVAGTLKYVVALIIIMLFVSKDASF